MASIQIEPVESSMIRGIGYDPASRRLHVQFMKGATYEFMKVPQNVHDDLRNAKSIGRYFHRNIREKFETKKL